MLVSFVARDTMPEKASAKDCLAPGLSPLSLGPVCSASGRMPGTALPSPVEGDGEGEKGRKAIGRGEKEERRGERGKKRRTKERKEKKGANYTLQGRVPVTTASKVSITSYTATSWEPGL